MIKRIAVVTALVGAPLFGVLAPAAHAADCTSSPSVHVELHANINGTPVDVDQCLPQ